MNTYNKKVAILAVFFVFGLATPSAALAATNPSLGAAASFSVLAQTLLTGISTISGDVGMNNIGASITALLPANVTGTIYSTDGLAPSTAVISAAVQADASAAYTVTIPGLPIEGAPIPGAELNGITRGPGVYDLVGASITLSGGVLTLDGAGTYIFRTPANFTSSGSINFINGARACDLFWNVGSDATINGTSFAGTILSSTGVHFGPGVALDGRALAVGADVTLGVDGIISGPSCAPPPASLTVTKIVINDDGGTKTVSDFPLFINGFGVTSGVASTTLTAGLYTVSETSDAGYTTTIGGDCATDGTITLASGEAKACTITNDDIAPPAPPPSSGGGTSIIYGCKDINASNYNYFSASKPSLCVYAPTIVTTTTTAPGFVLGTSTPGFPNTGLPPRDDTPWYTVILLLLRDLRFF